MRGDEEKKIDVYICPKEYAGYGILIGLGMYYSYKFGKWVGKKIEQRKNRIPGSMDPEEFFSGKWNKI